LHQDAAPKKGEFNATDAFYIDKKLVQNFTFAAVKVMVNDK
jgi:hypothetical protein